MSLAVIQSRAKSGIDAPLVSVEVHLSNGLPAFHLVGLPEISVKESKDRVRSAIINSHFEFPARRITVNLAPADIPKEGSRFDLAIAIGILAASEQIPANYLNEYKLTDISLLLFVTIIGFFIFNYPPAKLYLGDSGSLFIGYCLGFISILFNWTPVENTIYTSFINPLFLFFIIPLLDSSIVISHRIKKGISPTIGGTDHISHRLLAKNISVTKVLLSFILYIITCFILILISIVNEGLLAYLSLFVLFSCFIFSFLKIRKMNILDYFSF